MGGPQSPLLLFSIHFFCCIESLHGIAWMRCQDSCNGVGLRQSITKEVGMEDVGFSRASSVKQVLYDGNQ